MIETTTTSTQILPSQPLPTQYLAVSRIKTYTRKLAEIERFIEQYAKQPATGEPQVTVHTYWGHA